MKKEYVVIIKPRCAQNTYEHVPLEISVYKYFKLFFGKGYFNLSEWKAPISPNFQKISRILEGSYLSEFQNEGGSNLSEFGLLC